MGRTQWLSEGAEKLAAELSGMRGPHCDVAIVGSGYGGAVAAARLAGALEDDGERARVWVLERGREFIAGAFPDHFADLPGQVRINADGQAKTRGILEGLFDLRIGTDVSALLGNGLGGGSLINAGVLAQPLPSVFQQPPWPRELAGGALDDAFDQAREFLGGSQVPGDGPPKLASLRSVASNIKGADARAATIAVTFRDGTNPAGVAQNTCVGCGDCFTGCNHDAKNTLAMNYLPLAFQRGAKLVTGITVLSLERSDRGWKLNWRFTDEQNRLRYRGEPPALVAKRVILCAGAYGSTGILLRSQERGLSLSGRRLGERFSANGDMIAVGVPMPATVNASGSESVEPRERKIGPTITGMIDLRNNGQPMPFVIEELAIPAALRRPFEEIVKLSQSLDELGRFDWSMHGDEEVDPAAIDPKAVERTAVYATIGDDGAKGNLRLSAEADGKLDDQLVVDWPDVGKSPIFAEALDTLKAAHAPLNAAVLPNPLWRLLPDQLGDVLAGGPIGGAVLTVHPLGGCAMGETAEQGVTNALGQVFSANHGDAVHDTLAVLDGAIVPSALGTNPCLTIAALAEHAVPRLAQRWQLELAADDYRDRKLPVKRTIAAAWHRPSATGMRLAERLGGEIEIAEYFNPAFKVKFDAQLQVEYDEIPNLEEWLRRPKKVMQVAEARLRLERQVRAGEAANWTGTVALCGRLRVLEREKTRWFTRLWSAGKAWFLNRGAHEILGWIRRKWRVIVAWLRRVFGELKWSTLCRRVWSFLSLGWVARAWRAAVRWLRNLGRQGVRCPHFVRLALGLLCVASRAGERRLMIYELEVTENLRLPDGTTLLAQGDRICGTKKIEYIAGKYNEWPSPWDQLTHLPITLSRGVLSQDLGALEVDLPYFSKQFATQLQIAAQDNQPRALVDLLSFFAYLGRVIGKIHIWSFREPDYQNPYPVYEFDDDARTEATAAARDAGLQAEDRQRMRQPGDLPGFRRSEVPVPGSECRLTRYEPLCGRKTPKYGRVLLIHGLGAGANTFTLTTISQNLVQHLSARGEFECWVLDLRTSIALPSSQTDWSFEEVALCDIPRAIEVASQGEPINVVAHCIGAAMFSMATLAGRIPRTRIRAVVLSQVGPLLELPPTNRFRGFLASYLKEYLKIDRFNITAILTPFNRFLDRILAAYPYPDYEWDAHHPILSGKPIDHEAYCIRAYGIYGRLFQHENINHETLEHLGDYLGHVRYRTYQQTIFYATMGRLTNSRGQNEYVTYENIRSNFNFPVCFLHGEENAVFHVRGSYRSFDLLASIFSPDDVLQTWRVERQGRADYARYSRGRYLRIVPIDGYGHQDCMIGIHAHERVFPEISGFLRDAEVGVRPAAPALFVVRPPRMGPIIGRVRRHHPGDVLVRLLYAPNASRSVPCYALSFLLFDGQPVKGSGRFHAIERTADQERPTQILEVSVPDDRRDYSIVLVTVHREQYEPEPLRESGEPRPEDPFGEDLDRFTDVAFPETVDQAIAMPPDAIDRMSYPQQVLDVCHDIGLNGVPLPAAPRVADERYSCPLSAAILSSDSVRAATDPQAQQVRFALASCRYAATMTDREAADATFGRMRNLLERPVNGRLVPQLLFLVGDQIYADATYGAFDPTEDVERYDQRYFEVWTAPNAREVLRRLPMYPMLDDHELEDNYEGVSTEPGDIEAGVRAFEQFQLRLAARIRNRANGRPRRYAYGVSAGGYNFFVADTRMTRGRQPRNGTATIMAQQPMHTLQSWLRAQQRKRGPAPKFVISPSVVAPWAVETRGNRAYAIRTDDWDGYPDSVAELLQFIAQERIENVVFLSGDLHCSLLCTLQLSANGGAPVPAYSVVSSALYSPYPFANARRSDLEERYSGLYSDWANEPAGALGVCYDAEFVTAQESFAVIGVKPVGSRWRLSVEFDVAGGVERRVLDL